MNSAAKERIRAIIRAFGDTEMAADLIAAVCFKDEYAELGQVALRRRESDRERKSEQRAGAPDVSPSLRFAVLSRDGMKCRYCGAAGAALHVDHVIPRSRGGQTVMENLVAACALCNAGKGDRT